MITRRRREHMWPDFHHGSGTHTITMAICGYQQNPQNRGARFDRVTLFFLGWSDKQRIFPGNKHGKSLWLEENFKTSNKSNQEHSSSISLYRILRHIKIPYFCHCSVFPHIVAIYIQTSPLLVQSMYSVLTRNLKNWNVILLILNHIKI